MTYKGITYRAHHRHVSQPEWMLLLTPVLWFIDHGVSAIELSVKGSGKCHHQAYSIYATEYIIEQVVPIHGTECTN